MGQLTQEDELRVSQLEIFIKINKKLINTIEKCRVDLILSGRNDMNRILKYKIDVLKKENEEHQDNIDRICKYNKIR